MAFMLLLIMILPVPHVMRLPPMTADPAQAFAPQLANGPGGLMASVANRARPAIGIVRVEPFGIFIPRNVDDQTRGPGPTEQGRELCCGERRSLASNVVLKTPTASLYSDVCQQYAGGQGVYAHLQRQFLDHA